MTDTERTVLAEQLSALINAGKALHSRIYALEEALLAKEQDPVAKQAAATLADAWQDVCSAQMRMRALLKRITRQ